MFPNIYQELMGQNLKNLLCALEVKAVHSQKKNLFRFDTHMFELADFIHVCETKYF